MTEREKPPTHKYVVGEIQKVCLKIVEKDDDFFRIVIFGERLKAMINVLENSFIPPEYLDEIARKLEKILVDDGELLRRRVPPLTDSLVMLAAQLCLPVKE